MDPARTRAKYDGALLVAIVASALAVASSARADGIGIPADLVCPPGTSLTANHSGIWCQAQPACTADAQCGPERVCSAEPLPLCVAVETYTRSMRLATDEPTTETIRVGRGACDGSCAAPASCETVRRCVAAPPASSSNASSSSTQQPAESGGGGCGVARHRRDLVAAAAVGLAIVSLAQRRRIGASSVTRPAR